MVKKWNQFIREFVESSSNIIDDKMSEIKELINNVSNGNNFIYEWENKNDHSLLITFGMNNINVRYEFDIDELFISKIVNEMVDFSENVGSISEGLDLIEKDIHHILDI